MTDDSKKSPTQQDLDDEAALDAMIGDFDAGISKGAQETPESIKAEPDKLRAALTDWMAVSDAEIEREFKLRNEKVKLQVVALTADKFRSRVTVTDADVSTYFDAHKAEYRKGEQRKVKMLLLDRDQIHAKMTVPAADVQRAYNDNIKCMIYNGMGR